MVKLGKKKSLTKFAILTSNLHYQLKAPEQLLVSSLGGGGHSIKKAFKVNRRADRIHFSIDLNSPGEESQSCIDLN